jgi:Formyl transferase
LQRIKVAVLIVGEPRGAELWTLRCVLSGPCELYVVQALGDNQMSRLSRARRQLKTQGVFKTVSCWMGTFIGGREDKRESRILDQLFDADLLREWWRQCGVPSFKVPCLNHPQCQKVLEGIAPDIILRVSGGILKSHIFNQAKVATLNIHHGQAPLIRGMSSIVWGIIEEKPDWIGATIHLVDEGIDTGAILWRGAPQLSAGDTAATLCFRAHLEAVAALLRLLERYVRGEKPALWPTSAAVASTYRSAPGLGAWLKFLLLRRGRHARFLIERAVQC